MDLLNIETLDNQGNIINIQPLEVWEQVWIHSGIMVDDDWNCNSPKNNKRKRECDTCAVSTAGCVNDAELGAKIPRFNSK